MNALFVMIFLAIGRGIAINVPSTIGTNARNAPVERPTTICVVCERFVRGCCARGQVGLEACTHEESSGAPECAVRGDVTVATWVTTRLPGCRSRGSGTSQI